MRRMLAASLVVAALALAGTWSAESVIEIPREDVTLGPAGQAWQVRAAGRITRFTYDNEGRIVRKDETCGGTTRVTLYEFGEEK